MNTQRRIDGEAVACVLPRAYSWSTAAKPLPTRVIRPTSASQGHIVGTEAPPWALSGPAEHPFDFCGFVRRLCAHIARHCDALGHLDVSRLLFGITQARGNRLHGLQARVTPLRFREGQLVRRRRGVPHQVQRYYLDGREFLYLVTFCLPRFLDQEFDDKLITLFHELYHISPAFNGDLRRHGGRYSIHSRSQRVYDRQMADLARSYLRGNPDPVYHSFLRLSFAQLQERHGSVVGVVVPRPKLVPI